MSADVTYTQGVKAHARRRLLEHAVLSLTTQRAQASVVRGDMLSEVVRYAGRYLIDHGFPFAEIRDLESVLREHIAYDLEILGTKKASELQILYLAGPEPLNDLAILEGLGCRRQNIWAIERDGKLFSSAVSQLRDNATFVRIHQGSLQSFFEQYGGLFDIVYFDGCGPLPGGRPNTLTTLLALLGNERLADVSALVTTFSEISSDNTDEHAHLMAAYYAHRYNEVPTCLWSGGYDPAAGTTMGALPHIRKHSGDVYSEFLTQFLAELACSVIPWSRVGASDAVMRKFFAAPDNWKNSIADRSMNAYPRDRPLLAFLEEVRLSEALERIAAPLNQYTIHGKKLLEAFRPVSLLERAYSKNLDLASEAMMAAYRRGWIDSRRQYFCDVPMPDLVFSTLAGVYGRPLFANPERSMRLSYVAKKTKMYCDVLVLDRCRSFFDSVPSIELWPKFFESASRQVLFRGCIDQIGWHNFSSDARPYWATAIGGMGEHPAAYAREFPERETLSSEE